MVLSFGYFVVYSIFLALVMSVLGRFIGSTMATNLYGIGWLGLLIWFIYGFFQTKQND